MDGSDSNKERPHTCSNWKNSITLLFFADFYACNRSNLPRIKFIPPLKILTQSGFQLYGVINQYMSYESNQKSCLTEILAMEMARNLFQSFSFSLFGTQVAQLNHGTFNNRYNFILQQPLPRMKMERMSAPAC